MAFSGKIRLDPKVAGDLKIAYSYTYGLSVNHNNIYLTQELEQVLFRMNEKLSDPEALRDFLMPARILYRRFGIDPTKTRPSSEALIRRVIRGKGLYRINTLVDACNLSSLEMGLPVGLYDGGKIQGDVVCRHGWQGESYRGIGKDEIHLNGKPVLADARGPFGNPSSDSERTKIEIGTTQALFVIFAPHSFDDELLRAHLQASTERILRYCGGTVKMSGILPE